MIRTLAVNCAPFLDCSKDDRKTAVENASNDMVVGAVQAFSQFSLLVPRQNRSDLPLTALDDTLNRFYQTKDIFRELRIPKSAKAKHDDQSAT
jgi:hypothetical protein